MTFFYDLNKRLASVANAAPKQLNESDKSRAAKGYEKYGKEGMEALAKAGREGKALDPIRNKYDKYDNKEVDEGLGDVVKKVGGMAKKAGNAVLNKVGHGDDADMIRDLQRKMGVPQTGKKPEQAKEGNAFSGAIAKAKADGIQPGEKVKVGGKDYPVKEAGMTPKQQKFAKLAPPVDKITFADKIAGAKKEVDEMLGDVAAEAMRNAVGGKKKVVADEAHGDAFDYKSPRPATSTGKFDSKKTSTGTVYTRKPETFSDEEGETSKSDGPKKRGRPAGPAKAPERVTSKAWKHKDGRKVKEGSDYGQAQQIYDDLADVRAVAKQAQRGGEFPQGFASRLESVLWATMTLLKNQQSGGAQVREEELDEKAVSKKQQKFMGMVHAAQKGEKPASKEVAKTAKSMGKKDAEDFASTKHKGLPEKKKPEAKKEKTEESGTTAGSVATASSGGKASKGMSFGKGVYESLDKRLESVINETMNISMNMSTDANGGPNKSLTVTATEEDADKLAELLKMAGLGGHSQETCDVCGSTNCGCGNIEQAIDENSPDWPTNTETSGNALQYSGGLNKPKSTGQTTTPVVASQLRRQISMEENVQLERSLFSLYNDYKTK